MLIGLIAKNGILLVEFADQRRDAGASVRDAIEDAANIRLRPHCNDPDFDGPWRPPP